MRKKTSFHGSCHQIKFFATKDRLVSHLPSQTHKYFAIYEFIVTYYCTTTKPFVFHVPLHGNAGNFECCEDQFSSHRLKTIRANKQANKQNEFRTRESKRGAEAVDMAKKGATGLAGLTVGFTKGYVCRCSKSIFLGPSLWLLMLVPMHTVMSCFRFVGTAEKTTTGMFHGTKDGADKHGVVGGFAGMVGGAVTGAVEGTAGAGQDMVDGVQNGPKV